MATVRAKARVITSNRPACEQSHFPQKQTQLASLGLAVPDEALGGSVFRIDKDDVFGIAWWGVDGEKDHRAFEEVRYRVNRVALEEEKVAGREFSAVGGTLHPEGASAGEHVEIFVAMGVVVRRRRAVDAKDSGTCRCFVGQVGIEQQGLCRFGKGLSDLVEVESSKGRIRRHFVFTSVFWMKWG